MRPSPSRPSSLAANRVAEGRGDRAGALSQGCTLRRRPATLSCGLPKPGWRNWQTRRSQKPLSASSWGFDPPSRHQLRWIGCEAALDAVGRFTEAALVELGLSLERPATLRIRRHLEWSWQTAPSLVKTSGPPQVLLAARLGSWTIVSCCRLRLAAARGSHQDDKLAILGLGTHAMQDLQRPEGLAHVVNRNFGHSDFPLPLGPPRRGLGQTLRLQDAGAPKVAPPFARHALKRLLGGFLAEQGFGDAGAKCDFQAVPRRVL
jgi:hypothetical protein